MGRRRRRNRLDRMGAARAAIKTARTQPFNICPSNSPSSRFLLDTRIHDGQPVCHRTLVDESGKDTVEILDLAAVSIQLLHGARNRSDFLTNRREHHRAHIEAVAGAGSHRELRGTRRLGPRGRSSICGRMYPGRRGFDMSISTGDAAVSICGDSLTSAQPSGVPQRPRTRISHDRVDWVDRLLYLSAVPGPGFYCSSVNRLINLLSP